MKRVMQTSFEHMAISRVFHLDIDECKQRNGGCYQICVNQPGTYVCKCKAGFKLASNEKACLGNYYLFTGIKV